jgi:hypothetical protein
MPFPRSVVKVHQDGGTCALPSLIVNNHQWRGGCFVLLLVLIDKIHWASLMVCGILARQVSLC